MATTTKTPGRPRGHGRPPEEMGAALKGLGNDLRTGGRDLFGDVETLVRSARSDTAKLVRALRADLERLVKTAPRLHAPPAPPARRRPAPTPGRAAGSQPKTPGACRRGTGVGGTVRPAAPAGRTRCPYSTRLRRSTSATPCINPDSTRCCGSLRRAACTTRSSSTRRPTARRRGAYRRGPPAARGQVHPAPRRLGLCPGGHPDIRAARAAQGPPPRRPTRAAAGDRRGDGD